jgi:predicted PurR-regulated permease PerM
VTAHAAWRIAGPYLEALLAGAALAILFHPLHVRLQKHIRRPSLAAFISTLLVIITVIAPLAFAITTLIRELRQAYQSLGPGGIGTGANQVWQWIDTYAVRFGASPGELQQMAQDRLQTASAALLRGTVSAAGAATGGILQLIVSIGAFHFSLLNGAWLHQQSLLHSPLGPDRTETLLETVHQVIRSSFYGVVGVAAAQGTLLGLGAWFAGLPIPALWGLVAMVASVLPLVGSALVWIPGTILLLVQGEIGLGIFFLIWGAALVANVDNVVRPLIIMASLPVSGLLVFIAILGGIQAFGLIGIFAGPVTLAVGVALLRMLREELQAAETDG